MYLRRAALLIVCLLVSPAVAQNHEPSASSKPHASRSAAPLDLGSIVAGVYRNAGFGLAYKIPFGWVERTDQMQGDGEPGVSATLLAVFERPPEAAGDTVNSAVIIAAESVSSYPGLKTAADYFEPLTEVVTAKGFKVENEPYGDVVGAQRLVRSDFTRQEGSVTFYQSTLAELNHGYVLSFTFIGDSEDDVNQLIEGLSFPKSGKPRPAK